MNTVNCSCTNGCVKCNQFNPCAVTCGCPVERFGDYAYIYNTTAQTAAAQDALTFSANGSLSGTVTHTAGTADVVIGRTGMYLVNFYVDAQTGGEVTAYQNSAPAAGTAYTSDGAIYGQFIISAQVGDVLTFVNTGEAAITLGGTAVNASVTIVRLF